jgi:hypothetical protein
MQSLIDFIFANKFIVLVFGVVFVNFILGVAKSAFVDFKWGKMFDGLIQVLKAWIGILVLIIGYYYIADMEVLGIGYSAISFFLIGLATIYYANSCLINASDLIGLHDVQILMDLDVAFKKLLKKGLNDEGKLDLSAETEHLLKDE